MPGIERRSIVPPWIMTEHQSFANTDGSRISQAQQSVAVRSSIDLIASLCSETPGRTYRGTGPNRQEITRPKALDDPAGDGTGIEDWIYQLVTSWHYRGNAIGLILDTDPRGFLRQVDLKSPDRMVPRVNEGRVSWTIDGKPVDVPVLHRRVNPVWGEVMGLSPISAHAIQVGVSLAAQRYGKSWFDADAHPIGILKNTKSTVNQTQGMDIKRKFMSQFNSGSREPVVVGMNYEWQRVQIAPEESQFLETLGYSEAQCCRIFGAGLAEVLGFATGDKQTYANMQDRDISLLKYAIERWFKRTDRVMSMFMPSGQFYEIDRDAVLATNMVGRYQAHSLALGGKPWKEINEVRASEGKAPVDWGNGEPDVQNSQPNPSPVDTGTQ